MLTENESYMTQLCAIYFKQLHDWKEEDRRSVSHNLRDFCRTDKKKYIEVKKIKDRLTPNIR